MPKKVIVDHVIGGIFLGVGVIIIFRVRIEKRMESLIMSIKKILKNTKGFRSVTSLIVFQYALIYNTSYEYSVRSANCSCGCYHNNTVPPSIMMVFPVAKEKLSLATHAATLATSSGLPHLFIDGSEAALSLSYSVIDPYVANVAILPRAKV